MGSSVVHDRQVVPLIRPPAGSPPPPPAEFYEPEPQSGVQLKEIMAALRGRLWVLLAVTAAVFGATVYLVQTEVPLYRAGAVLRFKDQRAALTGGIEARAAEQAVGRQNDPMLSQVQLLRSRGVAAEVVRAEGLRLRVVEGQLSRAALTGVQVQPDALPDTLNLTFAAQGVTVRGGGRQVTAPYGQPVELNGVQFTVAARPAAEGATLAVVDEERAIERVLGSLQAVPRERTDVLDLQYTDPDPHLARAVTNTTASTFQAMNIRAAQDQSRRRRIFIEEQLRQADSTLAHAQLALTAFREREQVFNSRDKIAAQQTGLADLEMRREEMEADRRMYQALLSALARPQGQQAGGQRVRTLVSSPGIASNPVISQLYAQLVQYELARDTLTAGEWGSSGSNPDVARLNTLIAGTEARLLDAARSHVAALDARIASLDGMRARNEVKIGALPSVEAEEVRLTEQVETVRGMADLLRQEHQRARIAEAVEVGHVEIVDLAGLPPAPIPQGRGAKLALGLMLGLMLGGGLVFVLEHLNTTIRRKEDLEQALQMPALGMIPRLGAGGRQGGILGRLPWGAARRGRAVAKAGADLVTVAEPRSPGAEAFRTLRTNLIFSQAVHKLRTLVLTSASPGEGKSTTTANLAVAFAQQGLRVLLVDCDLRRARAHHIFGVPQEPGFTELVMGRAEQADACRPTGVEGLWVLTAGTLPPNPAELLGSDATARTLEQLAREYDLVLVDTPPLLAASDAAVVGSRADGMVVVVRAGSTDRAAAQRVVQQLHGLGARVVGAVLNDPDDASPKLGYSYAYYSSYAPAAS